MIGRIGSTRWKLLRFGPLPSSDIILHVHSAFSVSIRGKKSMFRCGSTPLGSWSRRSFPRFRDSREMCKGMDAVVRFAAWLSLKRLRVCQTGVFRAPEFASEP